MRSTYTINRSFTVSIRGGAGLRKRSRVLSLIASWNLSLTWLLQAAPHKAPSVRLSLHPSQNYKQPSILSTVNTPFSPAGGTHVQLSPPCLGAQLYAGGTQCSGDEPWPGAGTRQSGGRRSLFCLSCAAAKIIKKGYGPSCSHVKRASGSSRRISALKSESISKQLSLCPFQRSSLIGRLTPMTFRQDGSRGWRTREERDSERETEGGGEGARLSHYNRALWIHWSGHF